MCKSLLALGVLATCVLASCHKKDGALPPTDETTTPPQEVTKENLIGSYLVTKVEGRTSAQRSDITDTWFSSYAGNCAKDDLTTFNPDESFIVQDGTMVCNESTDDTGTWKLLNKTQLKIDSDTAEIEAFTGSILRIVSPIYSSAQGDIIFTYTRQ